MNKFVVIGQASVIPEDIKSMFERNNNELLIILNNEDRDVIVVGVTVEEATIIVNDHFKEETFTIEDLDLYDIIQENNEVIWYMVEGKTAEGVITVKNMVNDLTSIFDKDCITEGMTLTKHHEVLKLQKPLLKG